VYFCEQARSTLLSIGAFKKANACFHVSSDFDTIDLLSQSGKLLIPTVFNPRTNSWPLHRPLWAPHLSSQVILHSCKEPLDEKFARNDMFKSPNLIESSQFTWKPEELTPDEKTLLFWHRLFGHASL
jgi:hypothetical protein